MTEETLKRELVRWVKRDPTPVRIRIATMIILKNRGLTTVGPRRKI